MQNAIISREHVTPTHDPHAHSCDMEGVTPECKLASGVGFKHLLMCR